MSNCKPVTTPLNSHFKLSAKSCPASEEEIEKISHVPYSNVVRNLMCAMVCTRLNLSYAISVVSRYIHNPGKDHREAMKWIFHYVKGFFSIGVYCLTSLRLQPMMLQDLLTLIMVEILIIGVLLLATSSLYVRVLSLGKHPYSLL